MGISSACPHERDIEESGRAKAAAGWRFRDSGLPVMARFSEPCKGFRPDLPARLTADPRTAE